jgi:hypothetical protein
MRKFARIFDLQEGAQVLIHVEYDSNEDNFKIILQTDLEVCLAEKKISQLDEFGAYKFLEEYTKADAITFRSQMLSYLK